MSVTLSYGLQKSLRGAEMSIKDILKIPLDGEIFVDDSRFISSIGLFARKPRELGVLFERAEILWLRLEDPISHINTLGQIDLKKTVSGQQCVNIADARTADGNSSVLETHGLLLQSHIRHHVADFIATFFPPRH